MYSVTLQQGVQGDGVLLPGSGVFPSHFPHSGRRRRYASDTEELLYSQSILQHRQDTIERLMPSLIIQAAFMSTIPDKGYIYSVSRLTLFFPAKNQDYRKGSPDKR